jgi:hypothetical protein
MENRRSNRYVTAVKDPGPGIEWVGSEWNIVSAVEVETPGALANSGWAKTGSRAIGRAGIKRRTCISMLEVKRLAWRRSPYRGRQYRISLRRKLGMDSMAGVRMWRCQRIPSLPIKQIKINQSIKGRGRYT